VGSSVILADAGRPDGDEGLHAAESDGLARARPFAYVADPVCVAAAILYALNRWFLKPHHIGGWFTAGYLNDVLCLPLFLPAILLAQRVVGVRPKNAYPRAWEMLQHWVIFSVAFEVVLPRFPRVYRTTADPLDVVAYLAGGLLAQAVWTGRGRKRTGA
jgi:hypothetical protein